MDDPVLTAEISGHKAILLSWTFGSNADFQVFWKSSVPAGQEMVLLGSTNAFSFTTPNLEPSKIYTFYVRANVGSAFYYSNTIELFVSCGKGIALEADPPPSPPSKPPSGIIPIDALNFNNPVAVQNISYWYGGANGGANLYFPSFTIPLQMEIHDVAANGAYGYVVPGSASYVIDDAEHITVTFLVQGKNHPYVAQGFGYGIRFRYDNPLYGAEYSSVWEQPIAVGNDSWRDHTFSITIRTWTIDLGV
jgi:hypothetical protein